MENELVKLVENSIITTYKKRIWAKFVVAINEYKLIEEGDKIAICISGGKDSMLLAKLMQELKKHKKVNFDLEFLAMDPGYNEVNREMVHKNAKLLNIPITMFESSIFDYVASVEEGSPCYLCARMRRGALYAKAKELGCNKIALGHHFDDVVETTLLSMLYTGQINTMMPKLHSDNFEGLELIRPMVRIREKDILNWKTKNNLNFINCACRFTETCDISQDGSGSKRKEMKRLVEYLEGINPIFAENIYTSLKNVNLDTVFGYKKNGVKTFFLDEYDKKTKKAD